MGPLTPMMGYSFYAQQNPHYDVATFCGLVLFLSYREDPECQRGLTERTV